MNCGLRRMNWLRHELLPPLLFLIKFFKGNMNCTQACIAVSIILIMSFCAQHDSTDGI